MGRAHLDALSEFVVEAPCVEWHNQRPFAISRLSETYAGVLEKMALSKEEAIKALPVSPGWETAADQNPTTARFSRYSAFLISPATLPLFFAIRETYLHLLRALDQRSEARFIQCWYNVHRSGQSLVRHKHVYPFIGTFSAYADGSETRYGNAKAPSDADYRMTHVTGRLIMTTGTDHYHDTSAWQNPDRARVTFAFDIVNAKDWNTNQYFLPFDFA
jgi:hypothetical protein